MSQNPLPPALPVENTSAPNQAVDQDRLGITRQYSVCHPRWWLLSAVFCTLLIGTLKLVEYWTCTPPTALLCQIDSWTDWRQVIVVGIIWIIFLFGWLFMFNLGVGPIKSTKQQSPITRFFRAISQFGTIYFLLLFYSIIALACIIVIWAFNRFNPIIFSLDSIIVFVANYNFLYKCPLEERRSLVIIYAVLAFICLGVMFLSGRFQLTIFITALILIGLGFWSLVRGFLWRKQT